MNEQTATVDDWEESGATDPAIAALVPIPGEVEAPPAETPRAFVAPDTTLEEHEDEQSENPGERDNRGRYKPKHRARSQVASPADLPLISEYTKRIKAAEAAAGADIAQRDGESNRTFELRRRAELAERRATAAAPAATNGNGHETPAAVAPVAAPSAQSFIAPLPPVKAAADDPEPDPTKYEDLTKYLRDQSLWAGRETLRQAHAEQAKIFQQHHIASETTRLRSQWTAGVEAAKKKYNDFESVAFSQTTPIPSGSIPHTWIAEHKAGAELLYHFHRNPAELQTILRMPQLEQIEAVTLLAHRFSGKQEPAPKPAPKPAAAVAPKPPTPVRTAPVSAPKDAPGDEDSLEAHEAHFYKSRRGRR